MSLDTLAALATRDKRFPVRPSLRSLLGTANSPPVPSSERSERIEGRSPRQAWRFFRAGFAGAGCCATRRSTFMLRLTMLPCRASIFDRMRL